MGYQTWQETLVTQQAVGTLFNAYTTAKSVINPQAIIPIAPSFWYIGKKVRIVFKAGVSNIVTTPGTFQIQVKLGPTANIVVYDSGAMQLNATAHTTLPFWGEIELICRSVGSGTSATLFGLGQFTGRMLTLTAGQTDDAQGMQTLLAPATAPGVGTGFDSTVTSLLDLWAGFSISNAGNGIQIQSYSVEALN